MEPLSDPYDVGESIYLNALFLTGSTIGTILAGQTLLLVRETLDLTLTPGAVIVVVGAGAVGGDLTTTVTSATGQRVTLADTAFADAKLVPVGNPAAPTTVTLKVRKPDNTVETLVTTNPSSGRYRGVFTPATDGDFYYRWTGTGTASAAKWRKFVVRPQRVT